MSKSLMINNQAHEPIYEIVFETAFEKLAEKVKQIGLEGRKVCIVMDSNTSHLYGEMVRKVLEPVSAKVISFQFPAGELHKTLDTVRNLYEFLIQKQFDRNDYIAALGGGVVGDLAGFAAATYLRGIPFIQIPTTLLAQSDSSIGGKTGVDFDGYKNMVGAFCMPRLVYMNTSVLKTLDDRTYRSGMGEVIKHGLIRSRAFYSEIMSKKDAILSKDPEIMTKIDCGNCEIKRAVVEEDPTEKGIRGLLNFGHTLGHAIEKQLAGSMYHGECVAVGMIGAAYISWKKGNLSWSDVEEIRNTILAFGLPVSACFDVDAALAATKNDKKMKNGVIRFVLLKQLGEAYLDTTVTMDEMRAALAYVREGNE